MSQNFENLKRAALESEQSRPDPWDLLWTKWRKFRGCPDAEESAAYDEGRLNLARRLWIWWHIRKCTFCRSEFAALHRMRDTFFRSEEDVLTDEMQELDRQNPGWDRASHVIAAKALLAGGTKRSTLVGIYGEDIIREAERDLSNS